MAPVASNRCHSINSSGQKSWVHYKAPRRVGIRAACMIEKVVFNSDALGILPATGSTWRSRMSEGSRWSNMARAAGVRARPSWSRKSDKRSIRFPSTSRALRAMIGLAEQCAELRFRSSTLLGSPRLSPGDANILRRSRAVPHMSRSQFLMIFCRNYGSLLGATTTISSVTASRRGPVPRSQSAEATP